MIRQSKEREAREKAKEKEKEIARNKGGGKMPGGIASMPGAAAEGGRGRWIGGGWRPRARRRAAHCRTLPRHAVLHLAPRSRRAHAVPRRAHAVPRRAYARLHRTAPTLCLHHAAPQKRRRSGL